MLDIRLESFGLNAKLLDPPKPMGWIHHHQEIELNYLFCGGVTYLHRWSRRKLVPRRLTVFWGATPLSLVEVQPGSEMAWITVPLPWVLQWGLPGPFVRALMEGRWWTEARERTVQDRYPVMAWTQELIMGGEDRHDALLLEIQACFLRLAAQKGSQAGDLDELASPSAGLRAEGGHWDNVSKIARFMAERFAEDINVSDIARAAGLHPKYAMAVFRRATGETIRTFLIQHRITHAQRLLITTDQKVVDIALASGFQSLSAFYSGFEEMMGETPNEFRRRTRHMSELTGDAR